MKKDKKKKKDFFSHERIPLEIYLIKFSEIKY